MWAADSVNPDSNRYTLNVCIPPNSSVAANMMILGGKACGKGSDHEGQVLLNGIRALMRETAEGSFSSPTA